MIPGVVSRVQCYVYISAAVSVADVMSSTVAIPIKVSARAISVIINPHVGMAQACVEDVRETRLVKFDVSWRSRQRHNVR
jgi:hypothetical protein